MIGEAMLKRKGVSGVVFNYLLRTNFAAVTGQPVTLANPQTLDTPGEGMITGQLKCVQNSSATANRIYHDALDFNRNANGPPGAVMVGGAAQNNALVLKAKFKAISAGDVRAVMGIYNSEVVALSASRFLTINGSIYVNDYWAVGSGFAQGTTFECVMFQFASPAAGPQWAYFVKLPGASVWRWGGVAKGAYTGTIYPLICSNTGEVEANLSVINDFSSTLLSAWTQFATAVRASSPFDACCNRICVWLQAAPPSGQQIEIRFKQDASGLNYWKFVLKPSGSNNIVLSKVIAGVDQGALATASHSYGGVKGFNFICCPDLGVVKFIGSDGYPYLSYATIDSFNAAETRMDIIIPTSSVIDSGAQTVIAAYEGHTALEDIAI